MLGECLCIVGATNPLEGNIARCPRRQFTDADGQDKWVCTFAPRLTEGCPRGFSVRAMIPVVDKIAVGRSTMGELNNFRHS